MLTLQSKVYIPSHPPPLRHGHSFVPAYILWGIARTESDFTELAVSKDGLDLGMFQLRSKFHWERDRRYGHFNPFDAMDSTRVAIGILTDAYHIFHSWPLAITAFHRGVGWTKLHNVDILYVKKVLRGN